jgi:hypothetical protein
MPSPVGGVQQCQLPGIALRSPADGPLVRLGSVPARLDIVAAAENESIEPRDDLGGAPGPQDGQQHRDAAGRLDRSGIASGQQVGGGVPDAESGLLPVTAQTDDRLRCHVHTVPGAGPG